MSLKVLLVICSVIAAHGYSAGAGTVMVVTDFSDIPTASMPQTRVQDSGVFNATTNNGVTYSSGVAKVITIADSTGGAAPIAGVMGYFASASDTNTRYGHFTALDNILQTSWTYSMDNTAFTHTDTPTFGNSQPHVAISWKFDIWQTAPALGTISKTGFQFTATAMYSGTVYYTVQASSDAPPNAAQVVAGKDASGNAALLAGTAVATGGTQTSVSLTGLIASTSYNLFVVGSWPSPTDLYLYFYLLNGVRNPVSPAETFHRSVPTDTDPLLLSPDANPMLTPVSTLPAKTSAGAAARPALVLACALMALVSRLL